MSKDTLFKAILQALKARGIEFETYGHSDFCDIHGKVTDQSGELFNVEGSLEVEDTSDVAYSLCWWNDQKDYPDMIGRLIRMTPKTADAFIDNLLTPDFVSAD